MPSSRNAAPLVAAAILLIPVLYIGSYFALVNPNGHFASRGPGTLYFTHYHVSGEAPKLVFWPLEQIDRRLRPQIWKDGTVILQ
jgi:hypothetical protein